MSVTIQLDTPIEWGNETLKEITLRDLTVKDLRKCGYPFTIITNGRNGTEVKFDMGAVADYISHLGQVPPSVVDRLSLGDFSKCQSVVTGFFGQFGE